MLAIDDIRTPESWGFPLHTRFDCQRFRPDGRSDPAGGLRNGLPAFEVADEARYDISMRWAEFDRRAFREAVVNAFGHRDYARLGRVLVQPTDEGMTVSNPGGFIEAVGIQNLLTVESHGRNPRLMAALKRIGLTESAGRGVDRIYEGSLLYGRSPPDWTESNSASVRLFIPRSAPDEALMNLLEEERQRTGATPSLRSMMVLDVLKEQRRVSVPEVSESLHMSQSVVRPVVEQLVEARIVETVGLGKGRAYILSARVYACKEGMAAHTLQFGIDRIRHGELVLKLARGKDGSS